MPPLASALRFANEIQNSPLTIYRLKTMTQDRDIH
jgi:hypothetical protein